MKNLVLHILLQFYGIFRSLFAAVTLSQPKGKNPIYLGNFDLKLIAELACDLEMTGVELLSPLNVGESLLD